jgi:hypothetical protein
MTILLTVSDIQIKVTYGYYPNIRKITQIVSASNLKLGVNSIKIEDSKLLKEMKANPELKLYPAVVMNSTLIPSTVVGETYIPLNKAYYNNGPSISIPEGDLFPEGDLLQRLPYSGDIFSIIKESEEIDALINSLCIPISQYR